MGSVSSSVLVRSSVCPSVRSFVCPLVTSLSQNRLISICCHFTKMSFDFPKNNAKLKFMSGKILVLDLSTKMFLTDQIAVSLEKVEESS